MLESHSNSEKSLIDIEELLGLAQSENNLGLVDELIGNLKDTYEQSKKIEIKCFLSNEADVLDCYIEIHAGAGGTESQDWAEMLRKCI